MLSAAESQMLEYLSAVLGLTLLNGSSAIWYDAGLPLDFRRRWINVVMIPIVNPTPA